ncbi:MAG: metal-dependent hydrolase [Flavobacteriales bacterium]|nr:MAG: metal-dependent hydrolase [Flavobacteriales bacterium]
MDAAQIEQLKYPIGKVELPSPITSSHICKWIEIIESFPKQLKKIVSGLSEEQLDTPYRPEGWTVRQLIHHLADSHLNSYIRFRWALTEVKPVIKPYYEDRWAELPDSRSAPIRLSLNLLKALHAKWAYLLKGLNANELQHTFIHPHGNKETSLAEAIGQYAWHCVHHYAHINNLKKRNNW